MHIAQFSYNPTENEREKASNSYLMSLVAIMIGLPLPIMNLLATFLFFMANRKATPFVKWHCTQALLSQAVMMVINTIAIVWLIRIINYDLEMSNLFISYGITVLLFNLYEFILTIYSAVNVRKGRHVVWFFFGSATDAIVNQENQ